ncbi:MAG: hypothetical protein WC880_00535 [Candidatus Paceibacterota bacterium]
MTEEALKTKVRPVYSELQGYLSQAPTVGEHGVASTRDETLWTQFNLTIDELNEVSGSDYNKFKITGIRHGQMGNFVNVSELRTKLGGLIARLHGEYFANEPAPFSGMPSTVITQNQSQSVDVQVLLNLQSKIDSELQKHEEGSKERGFLEKLKSTLPALKSAMEVLSAALKIGADFGLDPRVIHNLLGL